MLQADAAQVPVAIVQRLYRDLVASSDSPAMVRQMAQLGMTVFNSNSPEDFRGQIEADLVWMADMVKDLKLAQ